MTRDPEDAARHYDIASMDGWIDAPESNSGLGGIAFMLSLLVFGAVAICGAALLALIWEAY